RKVATTERRVPRRPHPGETGHCAISLLSHQFLLVLMKKAPVHDLGNDLLPGALDYANLGQAQRVEPNCIRGIHDAATTRRWNRFLHEVLRGMEEVLWGASTIERWEGCSVILLMLPTPRIGCDCSCGFSLKQVHTPRF